MQRALLLLQGMRAIGNRTRAQRSKICIVVYREQFCNNTAAVLALAGVRDISVVDSDGEVRMHILRSFEPLE